MQKHVKAARAEAALQTRLATVAEPSTGYSSTSSSRRGSRDAAAAAAAAAGSNGGRSSNGYDNRTAPCSPGEVFMSGFSRAITEVRVLISELVPLLLLV
jgi:hypothetical protein